MNARAGFKLATASGNDGEATEFKGDEARVLLKMDLADEALSTAQEFLRLAAERYDEPRTVDAYGVIGLALLALCRYPEAHEYAQQGLNAALAAGNERAVSEFLADTRAIEQKLRDTGH